ncbi:MAG: hypothetical protein GVY29_09755 [Spirochaetes bacterium]|jgi:hypothetical protein|nr:hypothetical protein [Spirochaetota bacterium]
MQCRRATELLFRLDNNEPRPQELRDHLAQCPECRRVAAALDDAAAAVRWYSPEEPQAPASDPAPARSLLYSAATTRRVMSRVQQAGPVWATSTDESSAVRFWFWLGGGVLLILGAAGFRYADPYQFLAESVMGPAVDLAVTLATGIILTVYTGLFALGNWQRLQHFAANQRKGLPAAILGSSERE